MALECLGAHVGIYSSEYEWGATFGMSTQCLSILRDDTRIFFGRRRSFIHSISSVVCSLGWYVFYFQSQLEFQRIGFNGNVSGVPNFNDGLYRFGGWTHPAIKQYNDHGPCFDVDVNWYVISPKYPVSNMFLFLGSLYRYPDGWYEKQLASFNSTLNVH
jgi:hypothetical protein